MKRPAVGLALVFAAGIWLGAQLEWPPLWLAVGTLLGLLTWRLRPHVVILLVAVAGAGLLRYRLAVTHAAPDQISNRLTAQEQFVALRGVVVSDPGFDENRRSFKLELSALQRTADWEPVRGRVFLFSQRPEKLRYGDAIECGALLRVPPPATNPGEFDLRHWLSQQDIQWSGSIRPEDSCQVLAHGCGRTVTAMALRWRDRFEAGLRLGLEDEPALAGALAAIVLGERSEIPPDTAADFQQSGVFHVFAINGLHVGVVTAVVMLALRLLRVPRRWTAVPAIPLLVLYVFATGAHPGAVRALVMVGVWLLGGMLVRPVDLLSSLATAAVVILVWSPVQLFDGGFLLSFAVVTALATLTDQAAWWKLFLNPEPTAAEPAWLAWLRPDSLVPRVLVSKWRLRVVRGVMWLAMLAGGSFVAWLALVPLLAAEYHLFTPVSIVANLLVIPLLSVVIALGLASAVASLVWPGLAVILNNANFFVLGGMLRGVGWLGRWPWGHWFVQAPPAWLMVGYYVVLVLWMSRRIAPRVKWWITGGTVAVAAVILALQHAAAVEVTALDLRDGTAVFVNLPGEQDDFLVDGGGSSGSSTRVVVPFLRAQGVDGLAALVLSCDDKAHAAGLTEVARVVPVRQALHSGAAARSEAFWNWLTAMRRHHLEPVALRAGAVWHEAGQFRWRVLNPPAGVNSQRSDDNALVLLLEYGPTRILLASDIGQAVEHRLVADRAEVRAQILVQGRHSVEPNGTDEFLDAVHPEIVVQTGGPAPNARFLEADRLRRLERHGIRLVRTDTAGAITIRLTKRGHTLSGYLDPGLKSVKG